MLEVFVVPAVTARASPGDLASDLHVLHVAPRFSPYVGGIEQHVAQVAPRLVARGIRVTVLTTDLTGSLPVADEADGVTIRRVPAYPRNGDYYFAPTIPGAMKDLLPYDLVHVQGYQSLVPPLAMPSAHVLGIPYVVSLHSGGHSSSVRTAIRGAQLLFLRPWLRRARRLIAVSEYEAQWFGSRLRLRAGRFATIPNGGDLPDAPADAGARQGTLIVSVGRLEAYKGHHRILSAMPHILRHHPNARLRIVGSGPYEEELRRLAAGVGVADRTQIGPIPSADRTAMATLLKEASLVTLLSEYESQGISVAEALALQRPVLVTYATALKEYVDRGLAAGVPVGASSEEIADAAVHQLDHPMTSGSFTMPTWDVCADRLSDLYRMVVNDSCTA